jgi:hypothetical protein
MKTYIMVGFGHLAGTSYGKRVNSSPQISASMLAAAERKRQKEITESEEIDSSSQLVISSVKSLAPVATATATTPTITVPAGLKVIWLIMMSAVV